MSNPNILIVMTDHQRWDTVDDENGCITPNASKLAKEGIKFTNTFCSMAHCCPARATFMSGLYPSRHGVWNNVNNAYAINRGPYESVRMWSEDLKDAGYDLAYCGKWHISAREHQQPKDYGWRELKEYGAGFQDEGLKWEKIRSTAEEIDPVGESIINMPGYAHHKLYGEVDDDSLGDVGSLNSALEEIPKLAVKAEPWALYVGWNDPHTPYYINKKYLDMYDLNDIELPESYYDEMDDKPDYYKKLRDRTFNKLSEDSVRDAIRHYRAVCTRIDDNFGKILEQLEKTGQADNTLVLFCSDHGDYVGDHGLFHKQVPAFLSAYKVPAVMRWPEGIKDPGRSCSDFVSLADFAPTFLELAGIKSDRYMTGKSLVPFFNNEKPAEWREEICTQCDGTEQMFTQRMVVTHKHKYVYNGFGRDELYDLEKDPHEMVNLDTDKSYDEIKRDLVGRMWRFAYQEQDRLGSTQYIMVNTAPYGPKEAFRSEEGKNMPAAAPNPEMSK